LLSERLLSARKNPEEDKLYRLAKRTASVHPPSEKGALSQKSLTCAKRSIQAHEHKQGHLFKPEIRFCEESLDWDLELCMSRVSRERKLQVPESFERFCCVKICKDQSLKQEPV